MESKMSFDDWLSEVIRLGIKRGFFHPDTSFRDIDANAYREMFYDEGDTPEDTIQDIISSSEPD